MPLPPKKNPPELPACTWRYRGYVREMWVTPMKVIHWGHQDDAWDIRVSSQGEKCKETLTVTCKHMISP